MLRKIKLTVVHKIKEDNSVATSLKSNKLQSSQVHNQPSLKNSDGSKYKIKHVMKLF